MNVDFKISNRHFNILANKRIKVFEIQGTYIIENNNSISGYTGYTGYTDNNSDIILLTAQSFGNSTPSVVSSLSWQEIHH